MKPYGLIMLVALLFAACGSEPVPEKTPQDKMNEGVEKIGEGLDEMGKKLEGGLAEAMNKLGDAVEDLQEEGVVKKKPVNFRKLKELLPESSDGFERSKASGESTGMAGFNVSTVKARYQKDDKRINVEIIDAGSIGSTMMGLAAWSLVQIDKESDDGFERTTTYKGNKAFEKCNQSRCEFSVFVAERFLMNLKGRNIELEDLHDLAEEISLKKLEAMKDEEG